MITDVIETNVRCRTQAANRRGPAAHPDYAAAVGTLALLTAKANDLQAVIAEIEAQLTVNSTHAAANERSDLVRALALVGGEPLSPANEYLRGQHLERRREHDALTRGANLQRALLDGIIDRLNREHCGALRPRLAAIAKRKLAALAALDAADDAEAALRREITEAGYDASALPSLTLTAIGRSDDTTGSAAYYSRRDLAAFIEH